MKKIQKVAIANRGEVAVRIIHACQELGIKTVLLHSEPDQGTIAYRLADERICIGAAPTAESYLNIKQNVEAAKQSGAQAVHPGFGFLSENADFAEAVIEAGLVFIGPSPEAIRACGDKISAKKLIEKAGVPTIPGYQGEDQSVDNLLEQARKIGFPVIVKAAAGGGGRGMKVIKSAAEARELVESAQRESQAAFGSSVVFLEKYLDHAKHIEFQIFGDSHGQVVHLFERECSVQRRHQKIVEEAPSVLLAPDLRDSMSKAAVALGKAVQYQGAGTVEFLVQDGKFYFMEMNTRLQVEHPVTEMILGVDLVKAQIQNAAGQFKCWKQDELRPRGHAIECRIYAEDPYNMGIPSPGPVLGFHWPQGPGRRFEVGFDEGDTVTSHYDPMIAKAIVFDESRDSAIEKCLRTLSETVIFGVRTNIPYLKSILSHPEFRAGTMSTRFIEMHFPNGLEKKEPTLKDLETAKAVATQLISPAGASGGPAMKSPWLNSWRNT